MGLSVGFIPPESKYTLDMTEANDTAVKTAADSRILAVAVSVSQHQKTRSGMNFRFVAAVSATAICLLVLFTAYFGGFSSLAVVSGGYASVWIICVGV